MILTLSNPDQTRHGTKPLSGHRYFAYFETEERCRPVPAPMSKTAFPPVAADEMEQLEAECVRDERLLQQVVNERASNARCSVFLRRSRSGRPRGFSGK
jgi:hypothetical protein